MLQKKQKIKNRSKVRKSKNLLVLFFLVVVFLFLVKIFLSIYSFAYPEKYVTPISYLFSETLKTNTISTDDISVIENILKNKNISYKFVTKSKDGTYEITLLNNEEVLVKRDKISSQISSLQVIMRRLTMEGKRFKRLDLRFEQPVIVY